MVKCVRKCPNEFLKIVFSSIKLELKDAHKCKLTFLDPAVDLRKLTNRIFSERLRSQR